VTNPAGTGPAAAGLPLGVVIDRLTAQITGMYDTAERQLLVALAKLARLGLTDRGAVAQLDMLTQMQRIARQVANELRIQAGPLAQQVADTAAREGDAAAVEQIRRAIAGHPALAATYLARLAGTSSGHGVAAANAIGLDLTTRLNSTNLRIVRFADDAYRAAVADAAERLVLGREQLTPFTASARAWNELTDLGITGYTDSRGRGWNLASYVEMATRTAVQRAYNTAHLDRMTAVGIERFTVPGDGHPCPLCRPWEGRVLTLPGGPGPTIDEARAAGLFHPNCKHTLVAYFPGYSREPEPSGPVTAEDEQRYYELQRMREMERKIRRGVLKRDAAITPKQRARSEANIARWRGEITRLRDEHGLVERPRRRTPNLGHRR
jgi:hypothetical protein